MAQQAAVNPRPHGRDEVARAVIEAATELFAQRGPAAITLRDVAAAANVHLSQIHRYVGNKEELLAAVLAADVEASQGPRVPSDGIELDAFLRRLFGGGGTASVRTRLQARTILDGYDLLELQQRYPGIELATELLRRSLPDDQARARAALLTAFFAGWQLFGPAYLRVTGAEHLDPERLAEILAPLLDAVASAPPA